MKRAMLLSQISLVLLLLADASSAQYSLDYFLGQAEDHSPTLGEYRNLQTANQLQDKLNHAEHSAFQVSVTSNYLFTPYFNNHGDLISTDPSPEAVGYDVALFDGGLYSAQVNVERSLLNNKLLNALAGQVHIKTRQYEYDSALERHNLRKQVTDQYLITLRAAKLIQLSREVAANLEEQQKVASAMVRHGYAATQDYLLLRIEAANKKIELQDARQLYRSCLLQLYALCGIQDTAIVDIDPVALEVGSPAPASQFTHKYTIDSLAVANDQTLFEMKYQPQLQVFFNTGVNAIELRDIERKFGMSAGFYFSLPLFDGGQRELTLQQSLIARQTIGQYRRFSERNIAMQRRDSRSQIESLRRNIESLDKQIEDYEKLLEISASQLQQGNMSMIDYLAVQRNFTDVRKNRIEVETDYELAVNTYNYWNW
jgi:hypothetical protein